LRNVASLRERISKEI
jgi:hypothetical protein